MDITKKQRRELYGQTDEYHRQSRANKGILALLRAKNVIFGRKQNKEKPTPNLRTESVQKQAQDRYGTDLAKELAKLRKKGQGK